MTLEGTLATVREALERLPRNEPFQQSDASPSTEGCRRRDLQLTSPWSERDLSEASGGDHAFQEHHGRGLGPARRYVLLQVEGKGLGRGLVR